MPTRLLFIDNVRWSIIILVLSMHASDTYSPFGNWYYTDRSPLSLGERCFRGALRHWRPSPGGCHQDYKHACLLAYNGVARLPRREHCDGFDVAKAG